MSRVTLGALVLVASVFAACASDPGPVGRDAAADTSTSAPDARPPPRPPVLGPRGLPCEIEGLLSKRCLECHDGELDLPRLVTYEDLERRHPVTPERTFAEVALGKMTAERGFMPPPPRPRVTPDEVDAFRAWVTAGRPRGVCSPDGGPPPPPPPPPPRDGGPEDGGGD